MFSVVLAIYCQVSHGRYQHLPIFQLHDMTWNWNLLLLYFLRSVQISSSSFSFTIYVRVEIFGDWCTLPPIPTIYLKSALPAKLYVFEINLMYDSHLTCKVAYKYLNVCERVEVVEWNKKRSPPFPCCPVSCQCPWKKPLIEVI